MKQYRPFIVSILCVGIIILPGCAGRNCTPIEIKRNSDENLSCSRLSAEMEKLEADHMKLKEEADGKLVPGYLLKVNLLSLIAKGKSIAFGPYDNSTCMSPS